MIKQVAKVVTIPDGKVVEMNGVLFSEVQLHKDSQTPIVKLSMSTEAFEALKTVFAKGEVEIKGDGKTPIAEPVEEPKAEPKAKAKK